MNEYMYVPIWIKKNWIRHWSFVHGLLWQECSEVERQQEKTKSWTKLELVKILQDCAGL